VQREQMKSCNAATLHQKNAMQQLLYGFNRPNKLMMMLIEEVEARI
jgi:hypothetical protein